MELTTTQIKEIAENIDCGMICYIHQTTGEIRSIIDFNDPYADNLDL